MKKDQQKLLLFGGLGLAAIWLLSKSGGAGAGAGAGVGASGQCAYVAPTGDVLTGVIVANGAACRINITPNGPGIKLLDLPMNPAGANGPRPI